VDWNCGSLRDAVSFTNANPGADTIRLTSGATYVLSIPSKVPLQYPPGGYLVNGVRQKEKVNAEGDLDITDSLTIDGGNIYAGATIALDTNIPTLETYRLFDIHSPSTVTLRNLAITQGSSERDEPYGNIWTSAGSAIRNHGTLDVQTSKITKNGKLHASSEAIYNLGTMTLDDSEVTENLADNGPGAIHNFQGATLNIMGGSIISQNRARSYGGIRNDGTLRIEQSTVRDNMADTIGGGGLFNNCDATLIESTVSGNSAKGIGGGIINRAALSGCMGLSIVNSTIANNKSGSGGGIYNCDTPPCGSFSATHVTISGNEAAAGAGIYNNSGSISLKHSIVATNTNSTGTKKNCIAINGGTITSLGYNLDDDNSCLLNSGTDIWNSSSPGLSPLAANGGSGGDTVALGPSSDAIDAIPTIPNCAPYTHDERGPAFPRPSGAGCDIGAFEVQAQTGALQLTKVITPAPGSSYGTPQFPMTVTCTDTLSNVTTYTPAPTYTTYWATTGLEAGSTCQFEETPLPPPAPPAGCTWDPPTYSPSNGVIGSITIQAGVNYATVNNSYTCAPATGSLHIDKTIVGAGGTNVEVDVHCTGSGPPADYLDQVVETAGGLTISNIPAGYQCTVTEDLPTSGPAGPSFICNGGSWTIAQAYVPATAPTSGVPIAGGSVTNVSITNTLVCDKGYLRVTKKIKDMTGGTAVPPNFQFGMALTCSNDPNALVFALTPANPTSTNNPSGTGYSGFPASPSGISCQIVEAEPPMIKTPKCPGIPGISTDGYAAWTTTHKNHPGSGGGWSSGDSVQIPKNLDTATLEVTNELNCAPTGTLTFEKVVQPDPAGVADSYFQILVTCTPPPGPGIPFNMGIMGTGIPPSGERSFSGVPLGGQCQLTQEWPPSLHGTQQPSMTFANGAQTCTWNPATWTQSPPAVGTGTNTFSVTNSYTCVTQPEGSETERRAPATEAPGASCPRGTKRDRRTGKCVRG